jgi:flagellar biosynthesis/type III secretory pathway protein FliH
MTDGERIAARNLDAEELAAAINQALREARAGGRSEGYAAGWEAARVLREHALDPERVERGRRNCPAARARQKA